MKCKVRLTRTVEIFVEGSSEDAIMDWLRQTTPEQAYMLTDGNVDCDTYDEEIVCCVRDDSIVDYVIKEDN
jgi:hypothetical protein